MADRRSHLAAMAGRGKVVWTRAQVEAVIFAQGSSVGVVSTLTAAYRYCIGMNT